MSADAEQRALREQIKALAPESLPKGVGAYSAAVLNCEMKGWERFSFNGDYFWPSQPPEQGFRPLRNPRSVFLDAA